MWLLFPPFRREDGEYANQGAESSEDGVLPAEIAVAVEEEVVDEPDECEAHEHPESPEGALGPPEFGEGVALSMPDEDGREFDRREGEEPYPPESRVILRQWH